PTDLRERLAYRHSWMCEPERAAEELTHTLLPTEEARERVLFGFLLAGRPLEGPDEFARRFPGASRRIDVELALARMLHEHGERDRSIAVCEKILARAPDDVRALDRLGRVLLDARRFDR